jgi:hypothetical protein
MGPPSYMRSIVDRNVVMRRIPVLTGQKPYTLRKRQCITCGPSTVPPYQCSYWTDNPFRESNIHDCHKPRCLEIAKIGFLVLASCRRSSVVRTRSEDRIPVGTKIFFSALKRPGSPCGPPSLPVREYRNSVWG